MTAVLRVRSIDTSRLKSPNAGSTCFTRYCRFRHRSDHLIGNYSLAAIRARLPQISWRATAAQYSLRTTADIVALPNLTFYQGDDPLGQELQQRLESATLAVLGVTTVENASWESCYITGNASGEVLCQAAAAVVDELADRMRADYDAMFVESE